MTAGAGPAGTGSFAEPGGDDPLPVTVDDVVAAATRLTGAIERTPSAHSRTLSQVLGCRVVVKFENLQFVASFKERGALNKLLQISDGERAKGVVAMSAGNHAQAVAYHATRLGIDATIVMPTITPFVKVQRTRELGAAVVLRGDGLAEAEAEAMRLAGDEGRTYVHPFDDPAVIAGQGTCALEMLTDDPDLEVLVVPVGGGGLLAGMAVAAKALSPEIELIGVQTERYPSMAARISHTDLPCGGSTIAEGIAVPRAGLVTGRIVEALVDDVVTVTEEHIEQGMNLLLEIEKVVAEGAGATGVATLIEHRDRFAGKKVGVVITGGNVDPRLLASVIMRGLIRNGRLTRLRVEVPDAPGSMGDVTTILGRAGANIVEILHQRMFVDLSAKSAEIEVTVETLDNHHVHRVVAALEDAGYAVRIGKFTFRDPPPG
ncbi:MAG TPA: threonine ammonia-lyase [Acidimicrobiales bacterium]|nr:threonine ammonia-lyase [Acidimicrobiales bacterium]